MAPHMQVAVEVAGIAASKTGTKIGSFKEND